MSKNCDCLLEFQILGYLKSGLGIQILSPEFEQRHINWSQILRFGKEQSLLGLLWTGLQHENYSIEDKVDFLRFYGLVQQIRQRNAIMDAAVVSLCQQMSEQGIRIFVFKGQPLATLYPDTSLRQSGDVDFYCHPEDWQRAMAWFRSEWGVVPNVLNTEKDVEFRYNGIDYEMHRKMTLFMCSKHSCYWENVVMPEILANLGTAKINGYGVPTLSPVHNVLFVFVHIFQHLISDGVGLRQFCDWMITLKHMPQDKKCVDMLDRHLTSIGMKNAFVGLGAILTDYLGLATEDFPFSISKEDHRKAPALMENILEMGNFGHNKMYKKNHGILHGIQHLSRITMQSCLFGHYAPAEAWWRIPYMFKWWTMKLRLMFELQYCPAKAKV